MNLIYLSFKGSLQENISHAAPEGGGGRTLEAGRSGGPSWTAGGSLLDIRGSNTRLLSPSPPQETHKWSTHSPGSTGTRPNFYADTSRFFLPSCFSGKVFPREKFKESFVFFWWTIETLRGFAPYKELHTRYKSDKMTKFLISRYFMSLKS